MTSGSTPVPDGTPPPPLPRRVPADIPRHRPPWTPAARETLRRVADALRRPPRQT